MGLWIGGPLKVRVGSTVIKMISEYWLVCDPLSLEYLCGNLEHYQK